MPSLLMGSNLQTAWVDVEAERYGGTAAARAVAGGNAGSLPLMQGMCLFAAVLLLLLPPERFFDPPAAAVVWTTAAILFGMAVSGFRTARRQGDNPWIAPLYLMMAIYALFFGFGALVAYYWGFVPWEVYPELRNLFYAGGAWQNLPEACRLVLLGAAGLFLGASLPARRIAGLFPRMQWPVSEAKLKGAIVICAPTILLAYWAIHSHVPRSLEFVAVLLASTTDAMFIIGSYYLATAPGRAAQIKWAVFLVVAYGAALPAALLSGQMVPVLMPAVMILCGYVLGRQALPKFWLALGLPLALWLVLPFTALYKLSTAEAPQVQDRLYLASEKFAKTGLRARLELSLARTIARFSVIQFPAVFSQFYPDVYPYDLGGSFAIELTGIVPRVIWPDKPETSPRLNRYSEDVGLLRRDSGTSMVFDAVSEYYVNFGSVGVFVLSILHGFYIAVLYEWLVKLGSYLLGGALYLCLMFGNWGFFGVVNIFEAHLKIIPVWLLVYYFLSRRPHYGYR